MKDETQPQSLEFEQSILSGMLIDNESRQQAIDALKAEHFYSPRNQHLFNVLKELNGQKVGIEIDTVLELLKEKGQQQTVTASYLAELLDKIPMADNVEYYAEVIRNKYALRKAINMGRRIVQESHRPDATITDIVNNIQENVLSIESDIQQSISFDPFEPMDVVLSAKYQKDMDRDPKQPLGYSLKKFKSLSDNIDGIQPGFYVVAADTNAGKTAFLCNIMLDLLDANKDITGIYFSLDDARNVILNRFLSIKSSVPLNQVQRPQINEKHLEMLDAGYNQLIILAREKRFFVRDASEISDLEGMEFEIRRRLNRNNNLFVVIDGLYNLDVGDMPADIRKENIQRANKLKALSDRYGIPVICTGELVKSKDRFEKNKKPTVADLMESGKFAYNANLVLLLYPENWNDYNKADNPILKMKYAKNKLSHYRGTDGIEFVRKTSQMSEYFAVPYP